MIVQLRILSQIRDISAIKSAEALLRFRKRLQANTLMLALSCIIGFSVTHADPVSAQISFNIDISQANVLKLAQSASGKENKLFVAQAIKAKRIFSLIAMVKRIEKFNGGQVLDAELITPIPIRYKSWYYVIKHRAPNGFVSKRRYWAFNGKEVK